MIKDRKSFGTMTATEIFEYFSNESGVPVEYFEKDGYGSIGPYGEWKINFNNEEMRDRFYNHYWCGEDRHNQLVALMGK